MKLGATDISKVYLGSTEVEKAYLGSALVHGSDVPLPYDAEVEWLQGDGSAYIDTGIKAAGNLYIKTYLVDYFTTSNFGGWPFGGRNAYKNKAFGLFIGADSQKVTQAYGNNATERNIYSSYPQTCTVEFGNGTLKIGNTTHTYTQSTFTSSYNLILFGLNNGGTPVGCYAKIGATYITNVTTTLDLIPVRKDGVGYMYDKISGQLFSNAGTGDFILGNDKN
jgi:hypothetical protein